MHSRAVVSALLSLFAVSAFPQAVAVHHPLDALTTREYWAIHDVLESSGHMREDVLVSSLLLHEPDKSMILAWKPGQPIAREADVVLIDDGKTVEARVDVAAHKLEYWRVVPGVQAPITGTELEVMSDIIKKDPRVVAALKTRHISDLSSVSCEPIPVTFVLFPEQKTNRIGYANCSDSHGEYHEWGRSVAGLSIKVDLASHKVLDVMDRGGAPAPTGDVDYEESPAEPRAGTTPLVVTQPLGAGYRIENGEVVWQNWHFRFRLDPRVGPVLNLVKYQDGDKLRSVMYEGSLSEMYVPYMDPEEWWNSRTFLDAGEFLMGGLIKPLGADDCPEHAQFFSGLVPSDAGTPVLEPQLACMFEYATDRPAWRHFEGGLISARPSRELVLRTAAVLGNYDYILDWIFQQDGTIRVAVGATGIVETKNVAETSVTDPMGGPGTHPEHGSLVEPHLVAVNHDHYFSFRLDMDVDGPQNSFMLDTMVPQQLTGSVRKSIWTVKSSMPMREKDGILDLDLHRPTMWTFVNPSQKNAQGYPTGYEIMPGETAVSIVSPDDPAQQVGAFSEHQLWLTPYSPDELYASGTYVNSSPGFEGLPAWTKANRSIQNTDIVGWYTLGFHHSVRDEDWPVMPTLWHDFLIRPVNFFDRSPVMTLPHKP